MAMATSDPAVPPAAMNLAGAVVIEPAEIAPQALQLPLPR